MPNYSPKMYFFRSHAYKCHPIQQHISACFFRSRSWADLSTRPLFEFWWFEVLKRVYLPSAPRFLDFDSLQREDVFIDRLSQTNSKQSEAPTYGVLRYFSNSSHAKSGRKRSKKLVCVRRNLTDSILKSAVIKIRNVVRRLKYWVRDPAFINRIMTVLLFLYFYACAYYNYGGEFC